jgi:hypothetical protein
MTPTTLKRMILRELNECNLNPATGHFRTKEQVHERLVEPAKAEFMTFNSAKAELWIVLDEIPNEPKKGYLVVYSEKEKLFGLATKSGIDDEKLGYLVGLYGSFVGALDNM